MSKTYREVELKRLVSEAEDEGMADSGWLATYADMMTLLLTFFVMLLALAAPESEKYLEALSEVGSSMGGKSIADTRAEKAKQKKAMKKKIETIIQDNNLHNDVDVTSDSRGIVLYSRGDFFFKPGSIEILPDTKLFLNRIAKILLESENTILIEGHTDDVPMHTAMFPSNWELSTGRAASVARYFIEEHKMHPARFIVSGYAEYKPRFMVTPENRAKNRRVEIIIMDSEKK